MTTFFKIKGNVRHNGDVYEKDTIIEGEMSEFQTLVTGGLFEVIEGAETLEEAQIIVKNENEILEKQEEVEDPGTWGPFPEKKTDEETDEEVESPEEKNDGESDSSEEDIEDEDEPVEPEEKEDE